MLILLVMVLCAHNVAAKTPAMTAQERQAKTSQALFHVTESIKNRQYASALGYCEEAMRLSEDVLEIQLVCAELYDRNDQNEKALALVQNMRTANEVMRRDYSLCYYEATLLMKLHRWDEVAEAYSKCEAPNNEARSIILSNLAELDMIRERPEEAAERYKASIYIAPENPHAQFGAAVALIRAGRSQEAKARFLDGVAQDPNFQFFEQAFFEPVGEELFHRAVLAMFSNRPAEAAFDLGKYLEKERRVRYRELAKALEADLAESVRPLAAYPVVLDHVVASAIDKTHRFWAFANKHEVWLLDTAQSRVTRRIADIERVRAMAFDDDSGFLRIVAEGRRFAVNPNDRAFYFYEDSPDDPTWLSLTPDGRHLVGLDADQQLVEAPFLSPITSKVIVSSKKFNDARRVSWSGEAYLLTNFEAGFQPKTSLVDAAGRVLASQSNVISQAAAPSGFALGLKQGAILLNQTGKVVARIGAIQNHAMSSVCFDSEGKTLLTLSGTLAELWDVSALSANSSK